MVAAEPIKSDVLKVVQSREIEGSSRRVNVNEVERLISIAFGIPVTLFGLTRGIRNGLVPTLLGSSLIYRGVTGHSFLYALLGVSTVHRPGTIVELPNDQGILVKRAVTIDAPKEEIYRYFHDFQNAHQYMQNIDSVQVIGDRSLHWVAKTPLGKFKWDAEITNDVPGQVIAWRKTQGSFLAPSNTSVRFEPKRNGRENVVHLESEYRQFQGPIGTMIGTIVGQVVEQVVRQNLERAKELIETGEIATTAGQPSGRRIFDAYKEA
jgi:uncharacterized membrane protein